MIRSSDRPLRQLDLGISGLRKPSAPLPPLSFPPFRPHVLLRSGHAQTIVGAYLRPRAGGIAQPREVLLDDGDRLVTFDDCPPNWQTGDRVVVLVHGLGGSSQSGYMVRLAAKLNACGVRTIRKELRGFGASVETSRSPCHAGKSEDVQAVLVQTIERCPGSPITLVGFSMGGNIVLKLLGELEDLAPANLDSAVVAGPPIDLVHCAWHLRRGVNRFYDWSFTRELHRLLQRRRRVVKDLNDLPLRPLPRRLRDFDDRYTAPLIGYSGADEYYAAASSAPYLSRIQVPTLIITAADDPVIPVEMFDAYPRSSAVSLHVTDHGGHLGFVGVRGVDPDRRWLDWRIVDWTLHHEDIGRASISR